MLVHADFCVFRNFDKVLIFQLLGFDLELRLGVLRDDVTYKETPVKLILKIPPEETGVRNRRYLNQFAPVFSSMVVMSNRHVTVTHQVQVALRQLRRKPQKIVGEEYCPI